MSLEISVSDNTQNFESNDNGSFDWMKTMVERMEALRLGEIDARQMTVWRELVEESDRSVAIIGAAIVDEELTEFLKKKMRDDDITQALFDPRKGGALSSFSARIKLAYSIGLIGPKCFAEMNTIREIRNDFAHDTVVHDNHHKVSRLSFKSPAIISYCDNLWLPKNFIDERNPVSKDRRSLYLFSVVLLDTILKLVAIHPNKLPSDLPPKSLLDY